MAVIVTVVADEPLTVFTVKVADVAPAGMVIVAGTKASVELLESVILSPPVGAAEVSFTVPTADTPGLTLVGLIVTDRSAGGLMVKLADCFTLPSAAEIVTVNAEDTALV